MTWRSAALSGALVVALGALTATQGPFDPQARVRVRGMKFWKDTRPSRP